MHLHAPSAVRRHAKQIQVTYVIFDLLYIEGRSVSRLPYRRRRALLEGLELQGPSWQTPANHLGDGQQLLELTAARGLEGLIAKRLESEYRPGARSQDWLKIKNVHRQEFVIGGWLEGEGHRERLGALLLGYQERQGSGTALRYAGRVGSGFSDQQVEDLSSALALRARSGSPFSLGQPPRGAHFVEPELVAEVEFSGWTRQGILRHSVFKGLRDDKPGEQVLLEPPVLPATDPDGESDAPYTTVSENAQSTRIEVQGRALKLTNRTKVLYPSSGFTKGQLIDYYVALAPVLLGHLAGRPLTLKRYPSGIHGKHFFQKHCPVHRPEWVRTVPVWSENHGELIDYCLADDLPTLIWLANLASIELHTSLSRVPELDRPTMIVFDLDPGAPAGLRDCCRVALWIRELLEALGLKSVVKTSGVKGLQVYLPLNSPVSYQDTKPFAHAIARLLEDEHPELVISRMARKLREGRVLIDWSQNDPHKTTVCVYSPRATERPEISTPLSWSQVEEALSSKRQPSLSAEPARLPRLIDEQGDLFADALELTQSLPVLDGQNEQPPEALTRHELYERARELNLRGRSRMSTAELQAAIAAAEGD
jgi:bifunctional non-homologous end joining protein LigD